MNKSETKSLEGKFGGFKSTGTMAITAIDFELWWYSYCTYNNLQASME